MQRRSDDHDNGLIESEECGKFIATVGLKSHGRRRHYDALVLVATAFARAPFIIGLQPTDTFLLPLSPLTCIGSLQ